MLTDGIAALADLPRPPARAVPRSVTTARNHPVFYQPLTKCGCTYLRNVMFYLDHRAPIRDASGQLHPDYDGDLSAADVPAKEIAASDLAFVVVRDPVARFMSLYFDKFVSPEEVEPHREVYRYARQAGTEVFPGRDIDANRANCHKVLDHIESTLTSWPYEAANWHWKPQVVRLRMIRELRFQVLTLEGLDWQLPTVLGDEIPDLEKVLSAVRSRNSSPKLLAPAAVLDDALRARIGTIYRVDSDMYAQVRDFWDRHPANPAGAAAC